MMHTNRQFKSKNDCSLTSYYLLIVQPYEEPVVVSSSSDSHLVSHHVEEVNSYCTEPCLRWIYIELDLKSGATRWERSGERQMQRGIWCAGVWNISLFGPTGCDIRRSSYTNRAIIQSL